MTSEGRVMYSVEGDPEELEILKITTKPDFPRSTITNQVELEMHVKVGDDNVMIPRSPTTVEDLDFIQSHVAVVKEGNDTSRLVRKVYEGALKLDQSKADLNPRKGEVLFENANIEGRVLTGSIRPLETADGNIEAKGDASYLSALSAVTQERFQAAFENTDDRPRDTYIHENGNRRVRVDHSPAGFGRSGIVRVYS